jgi:prepilin-type N-terminal cleavage/methylation domain-containing protein
MKLTKIKTKAFTLIELLVVIAIIGVLSGLILVTMNGATNSAKDGKRKTAISGLAKATMAYVTLNNTFPTEASNPCDIGSNCTNLAAAIVPEYMGSLPTDPTAGTYYKYYSYGNSFFVRSTLSTGSQYTFSSEGIYSSQKNLLTLNQSSGGEDGTITGFNSRGSVVRSVDNTQYWQGQYSYKTITNNVAASEGFILPLITGLSDTTTYTASIYLKGSGTVKLGLHTYTVGGGSLVRSASTTVTLTSAWQKVSATNINNSGGVSAYFFVDTTVQQAATIYADGLQFEEGSTATNWIPGN